ncbi:Fumarylacetoacetase, protein [Akanthomyces lecanii RCEF 1005]|uniref:Fumarylacetoacetase, protein n=1 Tax=Akanthomyces lecanii RCEF 1005 TaxID=1081108 RepID=A0A162KZ24_CORDF|nr:Fumarylacetoacetase, protein [Akanthomyces lecanii RCEF 1005]
MFIVPVWSRLVRFISDDGRELCGEPEDGNVDVGLALAAGETVKVRVLELNSALKPGKFTGEMTKLLSPLAPDEVGTIRCVGLNFKDHAAELNLPLPKVPEVFMKPAGCPNGPLGAVVIPKSATSAVGAEVELAIVLACDCKNVDVTSAADYILGFTTANDITCRDVQGKTSQWGYCKGYDGFFPLGPTLISAKHLPEPLQLRMTTTIDGSVIQDGTTTDMIFSPEEIVSYLSQDTTLPRDTGILTGTPAGIGHSHRPPRYLTPGCDLKVGIERIGTLVNPVVADSTSHSRL